MYERFTHRAIIAMTLADQEAQRVDHIYVATGHLLLGILKEGGGVGAHVLKNFGLNLNMARRYFREIFQDGPEVVSMGPLPRSPDYNRAIEEAIEFTRRWGHKYVGTEHLTAGVTRVPDSTAVKILNRAKINPERVVEDIERLLGTIESTVNVNEEGYDGRKSSKADVLTNSFDLGRIGMILTGEQVHIDSLNRGPSYFNLG